MGIVAFNWEESTLLILKNRDNWENRAIRAANWDDTDQILCARCEVNDGTWLGVSRRGRVAFLVNSALKLDNIISSYGSELYPIIFLQEHTSPRQFANGLAHDEDLDQGHIFSLIVADVNSQSMVHIRKPEAEDPRLVIEDVPYGVYTLSLRGLDSPRDLRLKDHFEQMVVDLDYEQQPSIAEITQRIMCDAQGGSDEAIFLEPRGLQRYGTFSTTALLVKCKVLHTWEKVLFYERYRTENGGWDVNGISFDIRH